MSSIESRHEITGQRQLVDIRPFSERAGEWLSRPWNLVLGTVPPLVFAVMMPMIAPIIFFMVAIAVFAHFISQPKLPYRYPTDEIDPDKGKPGTGILYFGAVDSTSIYERFKEVWLSDDDLRKHTLILGSTGSGKSETLKSIFFNALAWSSGFFIADGKADNKLPVDVYTMARSLGRDQDVLILNFLMAGKTPEQIRLSRTRRSNGLNPFSSADPDTIIQMGANLLPKVEGDAKNWQEKALNLWRSLVASLCYLRDTRGRDLSISDFIEYMALPKVEELYMMGYEESLQRQGEWSYGFAGIKNYLDSLPGYVPAKLLRKHGYGEDDGPGRPGGAFGGRPAGGKKGNENDQETHAYEQHSYRSNQLMPVLNLLDKSYGFIFKKKYPEIDMIDVALRNRILVMLIPSLEKSAQEAESLGKLAIACLRVMMAKNLGSEVEGNYQKLILDKATQSPYPYVCALDELAYYFSDGIAVMFAQARSLGMNMVAAAQDMEKLTEGTRSAEAGAMIANTATKFFMRNDDQNKTPEMVQKVVGKARVAVRRTFRYGAFGYGTTSDVDIEERDRITLKEMQNFEQGQGVFNQSGATRLVRSFYLGKDLEAHRPKDFFVNRFLQVAPPTPEQVVAFSRPRASANDPYHKGEELVRKLSQQSPVAWDIPQDPVIEAIAQAANSIGVHVPAAERAILLYLAAKNALELLKSSPTIPAATTSGAESSKLTPPVNQTAPAVQDAGSEDEDVGPLAFLNPIPFARKPAEEVLISGDRALNAEPAPSLPPLNEAVALAVMDPLEALLAGGKSLNLGPALPGGTAGGGGLKPSDEVIRQLAQAEDSWIQQGIEEAHAMLETPRASDNSVVGLTSAVLQRIEEVEQLLDNPAPQAAAKMLERVVSARVTPVTQSTKEIDENDVDAFFASLQRSVES